MKKISKKEKPDVVIVEAKAREDNRWLKTKMQELFRLKNNDVSDWDFFLYNLGLQPAINPPNNSQFLLFEDNFR